MDTIERNIEDFICETIDLLEQIDELPFDAVAELYDRYDEAARFAAAHIAQIDPSLRVQVCAELDEILDRVVDFPLKLNMPKTNGSLYTPAIFLETPCRWYNVYLMKDCGLVAYTLGKELGKRPVMLYGEESDRDNFTYLDVLPGMEVLFTDSQQTGFEIYLDHLRENYQDMDVLTIYGLYPGLELYIGTYRRLRPDGKIYVAGDLSSYRMSRLPWDKKPIQEMMAQCDVVSVSCRRIRDDLNINPNVSFPCRWMPNGFYNPTGTDIIANFDAKENVILTVGRIGAPQKDCAMLLLAFIMVADALPDWSVRFVGSIEPEFQGQIDTFYSEKPELRNRVVFTGPIIDKAELYKEYAKAKVFALTSLWEGGTPNVYAEALFHGCMFVTSNIDGADDVTNYGELGAKFEMSDVDALAAALMDVCSKADRQGFEQHIPKALAYASKYFDWNRNAKKIAYMLYR